MPIFYKAMYFTKKPHFIIYLIIILLSNCINVSAAHETESSLGTYMSIQPESTDAPTGDEVQLRCELNLPPDKVEFRFRPQNANPDERDRLINVQKMSSYNITSRDRLTKLHVYVNQKTVGDYRCVAWFGASAHASISAKLRLASTTLDEKDNHKPITYWKVAPKNSIIIRCGTVTSAPDPVWSYYKDDVLLPTINQVQSRNGGYILKNITAADSGIYSCSAMNTLAGVEVKMPQRYSLMVTPTPRSAPTFLLEPPTEFYAKLGESLILECPGIANPPPKATWSRPNGLLDFNDHRISVHGYGLQINDVRIEDQGTYICRLDNGENAVKVHTMEFNILQSPEIVEAPKQSLTNESERLELHCSAIGFPKPEIYWLINGENTRFDSLITQEESKLIISSVEKRHAGIVQCFARNELGEVNEGALLQVNPKQIDGEGKPIPLGGMPHHKSRSRGSKHGSDKRRNRGPNLPNISKPNITRLNDESVMVKWSVMQSQSSDGSLPIQFFKVQYMMISYENQQRKNDDWITLSEDIPPHLRSYEIHNLKPEHHYKFRISAVYSNNDNKQSPIRRFHLRRIKHNSKAILPVPTDLVIETVSETEVKVRWSIPGNYSHGNHGFGGFYISYRKTVSADDYLVVACEGVHKRHFNIKHLEPGNNYEFKIQSFSAMAASEFSPIVMGKTYKAAVSSTTPNPVIKPSNKVDSKGQSSFLPLIVGAIGGCALLFLIFILVFIALKKRRDMVQNQREEQESKSNPNHIQADSHSVVNGGRSPIHRNNNRHLNGIIRINITPNPLSDEKNRLELVSSIGLNNNICLSSSQNDINGLGIPVVTTPTHQTSPLSVQQLPPLGSSHHRKTLERNIRNNHHNQMPNGIIESTKTMIDGDLGIPIVRTASIRRQGMRGSNNSINNGSPRFIRNHQRHQRSPMPTRVSKRRGDLEQSTASLNSVNSIEV